MFRPSLEYWLFGVQSDQDSEEFVRFLWCSFSEFCRFGILLLWHVPLIFGVVIIGIDDLSRNLESARPCVVKICARPHLSGKSWYLFWVRNPVFTIMQSFPVGNLLAMTAIFRSAVAFSLWVSLNISPRNLRECLWDSVYYFPRFSAYILISVRFDIFTKIAIFIRKSHLYQMSESNLCALWQDVIYGFERFTVDIVIYIRLDTVI